MDEYIQKLDKDIKRFEYEIKEVSNMETKEPMPEYMKNEVSSNQRKSFHFYYFVIIIFMENFLKKEKKYESKMSKYKSKK